MRPSETQLHANMVFAVFWTAFGVLAYFSFWNNLHSFDASTPGPVMASVVIALIFVACIIFRGAALYGASHLFVVLAGLYLLDSNPSPWWTVPMLLVLATLFSGGPLVRPYSRMELEQKARRGRVSRGVVWKKTKNKIKFETMHPEHHNGFTLVKIPFVGILLYYILR